MIYLFLADGFEEIEALTPVDMLRRAGKDICTVGVGKKNVTGAHGISVIADMCETEYDDKAPEMVILPGGMPGTLNLDACVTVHKAIDAALANGTFVAAICAAPTILGKRGILKGKQATCYPGMETDLFGAFLSDMPVVRDGNIITAKGMGVAVPFSLTLVAALCGNEISEKLKKAVVS